MPSPKETARGSASGGDGALGAGCRKEGEEMPIKFNGVRVCSVRAGLGLVEIGGMAADWLVVDRLVVGIEAAPTAVAPSATFTVGGRDAGVDGTAEPKARRASAAADSVETMATVSKAAPSPLVEPKLAV